MEIIRSSYLYAGCSDGYVALLEVDDPDNYELLVEFDYLDAEEDELDENGEAHYVERVLVPKTITCVEIAEKADGILGSLVGDRIDKKVVIDELE